MSYWVYLFLLLVSYFPVYKVITTWKESQFVKTDEQISADISWYLVVKNAKYSIRFWNTFNKEKL